MLNYLLGLFSYDVGIDLGTANTLVLVRNKGIVIREPSVVAIHKKTKDILAIGKEAKEMVGKTPANILAIRPLKNGVISDFEITERMLSYYIKKVHQGPSRLPKIPRPRVVIGIPSGVTEVERRAVSEAALSAGARKAFLVEEPMAAAIGAGLPIEEPEGSLIVDIGGGTSEMAVISLGGIVVSKSLRVAGDEMDEAIVSWAKREHNLLIGERTAEGIKIAIGRVGQGGRAKNAKENIEAVMRGRDLATGLPKSVKIKAEEVSEALFPTVRIIIEAIKETIEETPPELIADILKGGITLAGGGSKLLGLDKVVARETEISTQVAKDPQTCVVRGCGVVLENVELLEKVRVI